MKEANDECCYTDDSFYSKHRVLALHYFCFWGKIVSNNQIRLSEIMCCIPLLACYSLLEPCDNEIHVSEIRLVQGYATKF